jgi:hypothetical protein
MVLRLQHTKKRAGCERTESSSRDDKLCLLSVRNWFLFSLIAAKHWQQKATSAAIFTLDKDDLRTHYKAKSFCGTPYTHRLQPLKALLQHKCH